MSKLAKYLGAAAIAAVGLLPMKGLEAQVAQDSVPLQTVADTAQAESNRLGFSLDNSLNSRYMWNGIPFSDGAVYQTIGAVNYGNLSGGIFGNVDLTTKKFNELDLFAGYSTDIGPVTVSGDEALFIFEMDGGWRTILKSALTATLSVPLNPSLSYQRYDGYRAGNTAVASVSGELPLDINWFASSTWNDKLFRDHTGFGNLAIGASKTLELGKADVTFDVNYSKALQPDLGDYVYGGVTASFNF